MKTTITGQEIKRQNWQEIKDTLIGPRLSVWRGLSLGYLQYRRAITTRECAQLIGMDILTVRPRVTELVQLGFARCAGKQDHEGLYESVGLREAEANFHAESSGQELLAL